MIFKAKRKNGAIDTYTVDNNSWTDYFLEKFLNDMEVVSIEVVK